MCPTFRGNELSFFFFFFFFFARPTDPAEKKQRTRCSPGKERWFQRRSLILSLCVCSLNGVSFYVYTMIRFFPSSFSMVTLEKRMIIFFFFFFSFFVRNSRFVSCFRAKKHCCLLDFTFFRIIENYDFMNFITLDTTE